MQPAATAHAPLCCLEHPQFSPRNLKKEADLKPHRNRYWLTPKPDPEFDTKCADICAVYQAAPTAAEQGVQTVSIDEMTGIQALERAAPSLPMKPGHVERREFGSCIRHGTKGCDGSSSELFRSY